MDAMLNIFLPLLLYIFGIILLIALIVLVIQLIQILKKVDRVVDNVDEKINSFNSFFSLIDKTTDSISLLSDSIVSMISGFIYKFVKKNKRKKNIEEEEYINE